MATERPQGVSDEDVAAVLTRYTGGLLVALGHDGFRVPLPQAEPLSSFRTVEVPPDRATMVDLMVPTEAMVVVRTWERARAQGFAMSPVHLRNAPDRLMTLVIVDAREQFGVWLGLVANGGVPEADEPEVDPSQLAPLRPRQGVVRLDFNAVVTGIDDRAARMLGWDPDEVIGVRSLEYIHPDDHERAISSWLEMLSQRRTVRVRTRRRRGDGSWLWTESENVVVSVSEDNEWVVEAHLSDISDEMALYEELHQREELFRRLAESLPSGVLQVDSGRRVLYANQRLTAILGTAATDVLADQIVNLVEADRVRFEAAIGAAVDEGQDSDVEVELELPATGERRRCMASVVAVAGPAGGRGALVSVHDITEAARMREELQVRATVDALTGCLNRGSVIAALEHALSPDRRGITGVIYIDLDEFKVLNDTFGHAAGDEMLVEVAGRIGDVLREGDHVGRLGGDEFLVVCPGLADPDQVMAIASRLRNRLTGPASLTAGMVGVRASIGVAIGTPGSPVDDVVARADGAMYASKQERMGRVVLS